MSATNVLNVTTKREEKVPTGIDSEVRQQLAKHLSAILADTYLLVVKSHLYHWNVVGPMFKSIHDLTEEHYEDMFDAADVIAERIRALGHRAPVNAAGLELKLDIATSEDGMPDAKTMIEDLVRDHEVIAAEMRDVATYAGENGDVVTEDVMTGRITFHEKAAWMLRAFVTE